MKEKTLYMIGNAHIDQVWLWQWTEGFQETKATFKSALLRMEEYDDFIFTCSSASSYEWIEKNDFKMFEEIRARIKEGRWVIVGGMWVQPDCNIPSGESFARHILYSQRYFREKFGVIAEVGYNVDSFGHSGSLPQFLNKGGMKAYTFLRPGPHELALPSELFYFRSKDGSKVLTQRIPFEYCSWGKELEMHAKRCADELRFGINKGMCFYGVGNHGGGPTKQNIESIRDLNKKMENVDLKFSSPNEFFDDASKDNFNIPEYTGDLLHHASGCYSAHINIKEWNRRSENKLASSEKFATIADKLGLQNYPCDYKLAWKNVLFNQFHDILAGTSLKEAYDDARDMYGEAISIANRNENYAKQAISWNINIKEEENLKPIVVFNPHGWEVEMPVEIEALVPSNKPFKITDEDGIEIPYQVVQSSAYCNGRGRIVFVAKVPSLGWRLYKLYSQATPSAFPPLNADDIYMENKFHKVLFNDKTGSITSIKDDENREYLSSDGGRCEVMKDYSDTWSHLVRSYRDKEGQFELSSIKLIENGAVRSTIRVSLKYNDSAILKYYTIYRDIPGIYVKMKIDFKEKHRVLKVKYPVNFIHRKGSFGSPYGFVEREMDGEEYPYQNYMDISGTILGEDILGVARTSGFSIINDSKYSIDVLNKEIGFTVLRTPIYAHHDPKVPNDEEDYEYLDLGESSCNYMIYPHKNTLQSENIPKKAWEYNQPLTALFETYHEGNLKCKDSFLKFNNKNLILGAMKRSEDDDGIVIRIYEPFGMEERCEISIPIMDVNYTACFKPCEIKTLKIKDNGEVLECNLIEDEI